MAFKHFSAPNFQAILYPESIDLDAAIPFLKRTGYEVSISPLHDADVYDAADVAAWVSRHGSKSGSDAPKVGDPKKPHWHVLFHKPKGNGGSRTLMESLKPMVLTAGPKAGSPAVTYLGHVPDLYMANRYHAHMDDPDKAQYDPDEIIYLNGFDPHLIDSIDSASRTRSAVSRVLDLINDHDITNFYVLTNGVMGTGEDDMFDSLLSRTSFFHLYMSSRDAYLNHQEERLSFAS